MNRMIRGMAGLMVALGVSACGEDPSLDFGGDAPTKIQASPTSMFVTQGTPEAVLVRLVDDRNRSTPTSFDISNVSAGLTVTLDETYRPDYIGSDTLEFNPIQNQHRFYVTGIAAVEGSFTVSSSGLSQVVTVQVVPTEIDATISGPDASGVYTITAGENFGFSEDLVLAWGDREARILSNDGSSATFIPPGGVTGAPEISGASADYMPTISLGATPASATLTLAETSSADPGEAAAITVNPPGTTTWIGGGGAFRGSDDIGAGGSIEWVTLTITTAGTYNISVDWQDGGGDIDPYLFTSAGALVAPCTGSCGAHPEPMTVNLTPGTYWLAIVDYANHGAQPWWTVEID